MAAFDCTTRPLSRVPRIRLVGPASTKMPLALRPCHAGRRAKSYRTASGDLVGTSELEPRDVRDGVPFSVSSKDFLRSITKLFQLHMGKTQLCCCQEA